MTPEDAAEALAKRATDLRSRPPTYQEKRAAGDFLTSLGQLLKDNPMLQHALLGAGLGAGVGGVSTALGNWGKEDKDKRSVVQSLLTGGLAGAAIGGGTGLATHMLTHPEPQGLQHGDALRPGQFRGPDGKLMQFSPDTLRKHPELAARVRELTQGSGPVVGGINRTLGTAWNFLRRAATIPTLGLSRLLPKDSDSPDVGENMPLSTNVLPTVMLGDALLNSRRLHLGDRQFRVPFTNKRFSLGFGLIDPRNSRNPEHLHRGIQEAMKDPDRHGFSEAQGKILRDLNAARPKVERLARSGRPLGERNVPMTRERIDPAAGNMPYSPPRYPDKVGPFTEHYNARAGLNESEMGNLRALGARTVFGEYGKNKGLSDKAFSTPRIMRSRLTGDKDLPLGPLQGTRGLARLIGYSSVPLAEYGLGTWLNNKARESSLRELVRQHAQEVGGQ